ncbi:hypothetical protein ACROYT_G038094 [Oculina patagonica]
MKTALESHGGLKGVRAAVVKVNTSREINANKLPGISILNNFSFEEDGVRVWRAFSIGPGNFLAYNELEVAQQAETGLTVLKDFGPRSITLGTVSQESTPRGEIFSCNESTCVLTFKTREEAEAHMDAGKHVRESDGESVYDKARKKWANIVTEMHVSSGEAQRIAFGESGPSSTAECRSEGWALKTVKRSPRMGEKVKAFLLQKFNQGAAGGQKADPVQRYSVKGKLAKLRAKKMKKLRRKTLKPLNQKTAFKPYVRKCTETSKLPITQFKSKK